MRKTCVNCNNEFETTNREKKFCARSCYVAHRTGKRIKSVAAVLDGKVEMLPIAGCWIWMGTVLPDGHGSVKFEGRHRTIHRVVYCDHHDLNIDKIGGLVVRHKCDNPPCVNPDHLELGTVADNNRDAVERDRHAYAERHSSCKLTSAQVKQIRSEYVRGSRVLGSGALAKRYGVSGMHIRKIVNLELRIKG